MARYHGTEKGYKNKSYTSRSKAKLKEDQEKTRSRGHRTSPDEIPDPDAPIYSKWNIFPRLFKNLTFSSDSTYFWGRAGLIRLATLLSALFSLCIGFPGYSAMSNSTSLSLKKEGSWILKFGYGESPYINLSIAINIICVFISITFLILLLSFREVRCQAKWDDRNMLAHVIGCVLAVISAFLQLIGVSKTRIKNCGEPCMNSEIDDYSKSITHNASTYRPMYYLVQYTAWICKLVTAMLFSACSRIFLKNDEVI